MPDRRPIPVPRRRLGGVVAAAAVFGLVLAGPGAAAQELPEEPERPEQTEPDPAEWSGSRFIEPFQGSGGTVSTESFPISGIMTKERRPAERIVRVEVRFEGEGLTDGDVGGVAGVQCVPDDPVPFVGGGTADDVSASYAFTVPAEASVWPCNGRYTITAAAQSNQEISPYELVATLSVAVPPAPVTTVEAALVPDDPDTVTVSWEPLAEEDLAVDAIGYRVERAGPAGDEGGFGPFEPVSDVIGVDGPTTLTESPGGQGDYRYRVRALRDGPDGPVPSSARESAVAEVTDVGGPSDSTTSTSTSRPDRPRTDRGGGATGPRRGGTGDIAGPPTTLDTGFESTLDYGDRTADSPELAGEEGQSIIRTDGDGVGLVAPAAGALVLLGWAGHIAYLNRLAKQF